MRNSSKSGPDGRSLKDRVSGIDVPSKEQVQRGAEKARAVLRVVEKGLALLILALSGASIGELGDVLAGDGEDTQDEPDAGASQSSKLDRELRREFRGVQADGEAVPRPSVLNSSTEAEE